MKTRRGFTILELMAVIGVIAILAGVLGTVAASAMRSARAKRAEAMKIAVTQAIAAYYAQEGEWPEVIEKKTNNLEKDTYEFTSKEVNEIIRQVVGKAFGRSGRTSVLIDASALFVCDESKLGGIKATSGMDFSEAAAIGSKRNLPLARMAFGYPDEASGTFRQFRIIYNGRTDATTVKLQDEK